MNSPTLRGVAVAIAGCALSAVLIGALLYWIPADYPALWTAFAHARRVGLAAILASTALHFLITGVKWRIVTRATSPHADLGQGFYFYSGLIGLLGQIMPLQVAVLAGRSLALRLHRKIPLHHGAAGAAYDQVFDLLVPLVMLAPGFLLVSGALSKEAALVVALLVTLLSGAVVAVGGERVISGAIDVFALLPPVRRLLLKRAPAILNGPPAAFNRRTMTALYFWSVARFANLVLRAWLVAWTLRLGIDVIPILFANCVVTLSLLISFVPGALGIVEWGWVGALQALGATTESALTYAIANRALVVLSLLTLNALHLIFMLPIWAAKRSADGDAGDTCIQEGQAHDD